VVFWNTQAGLLAADQCRHPSIAPCKRGAVELTTDAGRTYRVVFRTPALAWLQTVGPDGAIATTVKGERWRTLDGGPTWHRIPSKPVVYWLTAQIGVSFRSYFVHNRGALALRVTRDGGRAWMRRPDPCEKSIAFSASADLVTPKLWWLVCLGQPGAGNEDKAIYSSRDSGRTWEAGAATLLIGRPGTHEHGGIAEYGYPEDVAFAPDGGFGLSTESRGTLYVSRDGGARFRAEPHVSRPEVDFAGGAAAFRGGIGYVLLTDYPGARLIATHDYGRTWHVVRRWGR
jgi:photosystem II stability/assembly factor-like uncharacterized protein